MRKFKQILSHEGPLKQVQKNYKEYKYNLIIQWENDEITSEPLSQFAKDDPVSCAQYALDNDLLTLEVWKRFRGISNNQKKLKRMVCQEKLKSYKSSTRYMFGFEIPRTYYEALRLYERNINSI